MKYKPFPEANTLNEEAINQLFIGATNVASATSYKIDCDIGRRVRVWCEQIIPDHMQTIRTSRDSDAIKQVGKLCIKQYVTLRQKTSDPSKRLKMFYAIVDLRHEICTRLTSCEVNNNER